MSKKAAALFFSLAILLTGCFAPGAENPEISGIDDYAAVICESVESSRELCQIYMIDIRTGWALTKENELLFTDAGPERFSVVRKVDGAAADGFLCAAFLDAGTAYLAWFSEADGLLTVEHTEDGGDSWEKTFLDYTGFGDSCDAGSVYLSFADEKKGYLLYCSTPAAGSMVKILLETADGGKSFAVAADLTDQIAGYPQGIAFHGDKGYLAVSYHGKDSYLYTTSDGGITWEDEEIEPALSGAAGEISYIDGYSPVFSGQDSDEGMLILKIVGNKTAYRIWRTADGSDSWTVFGEIPCDSLAGYALTGDGDILFLDGMGKLYRVSD